ncbi:helix-turn-helix domain-containing protein [Stakelama tenebrarum]|uniref:Transposase n=1 Tax=Stakelama tenebrarum TaxID=2711215 RepID=A0A6G6Y3D5_9SPHN|nr:helix-turn-helix domain-containing protein [Sphingosinithalassobacter tenebrarum]QIG79409.1 transposase [Sphingosinithalassobacter tenebrarum]
MSVIPDKEARCQEIARRIATGKGVVEACREIGISERTFARWRRERREAGTH